MDSKSGKEKKKKKKKAIGPGRIKFARLEISKYILDIVTFLHSSIEIFFIHRYPAGNNGRFNAYPQGMHLES